MKRMQVVLASHNAHKLREISAITSNFGMELVLQSRLGLDMEVEETGHTFEENSLLKASAVMAAAGLPALADDSGLCVEALGGAPGVYSARYGGDSTLDDRGRRELLLRNLEAVPDGLRQAKFVCVITLALTDGRVIQARGEAHGEILRKSVGEDGFGYDPVFYYPPLGMTFAQLPPEEKNRVSHRARALAVFEEKLREAGYADK